MGNPRAVDKLGKAVVRRDGAGVDRISTWPEGSTGAAFEDARLAFLALGRTYGVMFEEAVAAFRRIAETVGVAIEPILRLLAAQVTDVVEGEAFQAWLAVFEEEQARRDRRKGQIVAYALVAGMALLMGLLAVWW